MFIIIRLQKKSSAEYWIHFTALFGGVRAFGYNDAESEPICMKSGVLLVHSRWVALADFERDLCSSDSWRARRNFVVFCHVNNARFHRFSIGQISRNLHTTRRLVLR